MNYFLKLLYKSAFLSTRDKPMIPILLLRSSRRIARADTPIANKEAADPVMTPVSVPSVVVEVVVSVDVVVEESVDSVVDGLSGVVGSSGLI
ncbi:MAG: hypothetical protein U0M88_09455 [Faecalicoccus sp.]|uniref:hypothetical protein n=1 Tax=Faecalicoccus sp. TaxID=1971758 RepID=UPI002F91E493